MFANHVLHWHMEHGYPELKMLKECLDMKTPLSSKLNYIKFNFLPNKWDVSFQIDILRPYVCKPSFPM